MTPNQQPYCAEFLHEADGKTYRRYLPVAAWDEDGVPLVMTPISTSLRAADCFEGYQGVVPLKVTSNSQWTALKTPIGWVSVETT
ncbi:hypothetical protein [Streptomyces albogriseolus]|uniref:hypothetical protein n=1 Tax=Streptomyces albogriseolus TaxID=1887 RepID=UPI00345F39D7